MFETPSELTDRVAYEELLGEIKATLVLDAWNSEVSEDMIIERFFVEPGDLFRLVDSARWLIHATRELCRLFGHKDLMPKISKLETRIESGVKAELVPLVGLEGIGRVRGRMLFNAGFKTIEDLKHAPISRIMSVPYIGPKVAKSIKEQIGGFVKKDEWERLKRTKWDQTQLFEF
jgi:helicase